MKSLLLITSFLLTVSCNKNEAINKENISLQAGKNISFLISPNETDGDYKRDEESHYITRNSKIHLNKLLLFIGGSYSVSKNYHLFCDYGASIGLDVLSISYPNNVAAAPLGTSTDRFIFDNYRDEVCFGNQTSKNVEVNVLNSINTRAIKLLIYLNKKYPDQNWGQYLTPSNSLKWDKIIVAGHSQGSGHACYFGKKNLTDRVIMLSGPNDYSTYFNSCANWLKTDGKTPLNKHFALLHTEDEIVPFNYQLANLKGLGLLDANENPVLADKLNIPYKNARVLTLNIQAISNHSSTVGANSKLPDIWKYMFTTF